MSEAHGSASPGWMFPLRNLLQGFADQAPGPLLPALAIFGGGQVSEQDLIAFIESAPVNNNTLIALRLAFAKWDASDDIVLFGPDGAETSSGTIARRLAVVDALRLSPARAMQNW